MYVKGEEGGKGRDKGRRGKQRMLRERGENCRGR